eukprot:1331329-Amorphochlora_amoeboformis.AAC.3
MDDVQNGLSLSQIILQHSCSQLVVTQESHSPTVQKQAGSPIGLQVMPFSRFSNTSFQEVLSLLAYDDTGIYGNPLMGISQESWTTASRICRCEMDCIVIFRTQVDFPALQCTFR